MNFKLIPAFLVLILLPFLSISQTWSIYYQVPQLFPNSHNQCDYTYKDSDGGYLYTGNNNNNNSYLGYLIRYNPGGDTSWTVPINLNVFSHAYNTSICRLSGGDCIFTAVVWDGNIAKRYFIDRYNDAGLLVHQTIIDSLCTTSDRIEAVPTNDGGYYLVYLFSNTYYYYIGSYLNTAGGRRSYVERYDANNVKVWTHVFNYPWNGGQNYNSNYTHINTSAGPCKTFDDGIVYDKVIDNFSPYLRSYLEKLDANGNVDWEIDLLTELNLPGKPLVYDMFTTADSSTIVALYVKDTTTGTVLGYYLVKVDNVTGTVVNSVYFNGGAHSLSGGTELSNSDLMFVTWVVDSFTNQVTSMGFSKYDAALNFQVYYPEPLEKRVGSGTRLMANDRGGAFYACVADTMQHIFTTNFDSLLNVYPAILTGSVNVDVNQDCQYNTGDHKMSFSPVHFRDNNNNNFYTFSGSNGDYNADVPLGTYTVSCDLDPNKQSICPSMGYYTLVMPNPGTYPAADFYNNYIPNIANLQVSIFPATFISGFSSSVKVLIRNIGSLVADTTLNVNLGNSLQFVSATPAPLSVVGSSVVFNIQNLQPDSFIFVTMLVQVSQSAQIGDIVTVSAAMPLTNDIHPEDNTDVLGTVVVSAYDPNDKTVNRLPICAPDQDLIYKIRFQNTGTYYAKNVIVTDTISNLLDLSTFRLLSSSHAMPEVSWTVGNKLTFTFADIYLPDSNTNEPASHGEFIYSIRPKTTVNYGDTINNTAHIYFDFNQVVTTNTTMNIIGWPTFVNALTADEHIVVYPNPVSDKLTLLSSGFDSYEINNIIGQAMETGRIRAEKTLIDASQLPPGIYYIRLSGQSGKATQKFQKL